MEMQWTHDGHMEGVTGAYSRGGRDAHIEDTVGKAGTAQEDAGIEGVTGTHRASWVHIVRA